MSDTIWKHVLEITDVQEIELHEPAYILTVQSQHGKPCMWVVENPEQPLVKRRIRTVGTGHPIPDGAYVWIYKGTYQLGDGEFIAHVFVEEV